MTRLKKFFICTASFALVISLVSGIAFASFGTGTVTASALRLRSEANTSSDILSVVSKGVSVSVLEDVQNGWYKVDYNGVVGYMSAEYLDVTADSENKEEVISSSEEPEDVFAESASEDSEYDDAGIDDIYGRVTASALNVRSGPGTENSKIGQLSCGTLVTIVEKLDGWYQISTDSISGYVSAEYIDILDSEAEDESLTKGEQLVALAEQYLGVRYRYGGASPSGFDCSGFVYYLMKCMGVTVPRTATAMWNAGYTKVSKSDLQPGDLVFFSSSAGGTSIGHVGIYVGDNRIIHSSSTSSGGVIYSSLSESYYSARYVGACRVF